MIKAVLFPCDYFSIREVDSSYQNEFDAVKRDGGYEIYFYDYEGFVREGILRLNKKPEEKTLTVLRGWMLKDNVYEDFYNKLLERNIELITTPEQYARMHLFPRIYPYIAEDTPGILVYPESLVEKYSTLPSPFYTVDYAELEDGSWKILEAGDGQVSGLSDNQDADAFFRALKLF